MAALPKTGSNAAGSWIKVTAQGVLMHLKIQPQASSTEIAGMVTDSDPPRLKIRVAAPPVDGKANQELLRFLRKELKVPLAQLSLIRGDTSPQKDVLCAGVSADKVTSALTPEHA